MDDTDNTIWDALKREVNEETGLWIKESDIWKGKMGFEWTLDEDVKQSDLTQAEMEFQWGLDEDVEDDTGMASELSSMDESEDFPEDADMALELNFMIVGEELAPEVKLDPQEHLESLWANEKDLAGLKMTPEMRCVVKDAFASLNLRYQYGLARICFGMPCVSAAVLGCLFLMGILSRDTGEVVMIWVLLASASLGFFLG